VWAPPRIGGPGLRPDVMVEGFNKCMARNPESAARIIPDRDAEPVASLGEARESIAAITAEIAPCSGTDLVSRDVTTEVVLGAVGVERDLRPVQDHQQLSLGPHPDCRATPGRAKSLVACGLPP